MCHCIFDVCISRMCCIERIVPNSLLLVVEQPELVSRALLFSHACLAHVPQEPKTDSEACEARVRTTAHDCTELSARLFLGDDYFRACLDLRFLGELAACSFCSALFPYQIYFLVVGSIVWCVASWIWGVSLNRITHMGLGHQLVQRGPCTP